LAGGFDVKGSALGDSELLEGKCGLGNKEQVSKKGM